MRVTETCCVLLLVACGNCPGCVRVLLVFLFLFLFSILPIHYLRPSFSFPPSRNSDPGSHSRLFSPPPTKALVRWATGKSITNRLPKLSLITLSPPGADRIYGSTCHQHVVPISGDPEVFQTFLTRGNPLFFKKLFHGGREIRSHDQRPMVLPTTSFVKVLVRCSVGKQLK